MFNLLIATAYLASAAQAAPPIPDGRIVGGMPTSIESYPYQASLQVISLHRCGAVVISEDYVLTAAHCTYTIDEYYLTVRAGSTYYNSGGVVIPVETAYEHPSYNRPTIDYDISVVRLSSPLPFGSSIAPLPLPEYNQSLIVGAIGQVSGWGALTEGGVSPTQLQAVEVPIVSLEECRAAYGSEHPVTDRMMCAGVPEGGKSPCQGDSGGAFVVNGTLIGLVSWAEGCARPNYPNVFASVPALREYIAEITGF